MSNVERMTGMTAMSRTRRRDGLTAQPWRSIRVIWALCVVLQTIRMAECHMDDTIVPPLPDERYSDGDNARNNERQLRRAPPPPGEDLDEFLIQELSRRMRPRELIFSSSDEKVVADPQQLYLLHHMKTGGSSINTLIECAIDRMKQDFSQDVPWGHISECEGEYYQHCLEGGCNETLRHSTFMEYCMPLFQVNAFDWILSPNHHNIKNTTSATPAITILRDPVERVWSMYRFETLECFQCQKLTTIYEHMEAGTTSELWCHNDPNNKTCENEPEEYCLAQLTNHQTRNLLSTSLQDQHTMGDEQKVDEAVSNLRQLFTVVGITEELQVTRNMLGKVFPWMADDYGNTKCKLPHANASPSNNHCGPNNTHWNLPKKPDEQTRKAIVKHNQLDLKVYQQAKQLFDLERRALGV
eukprot:scaffold85724_cov50-Attheya_sp.AAC.7